MLVRILAEIAQSKLTSLLNQLQDQFSDLMNIISDNYSLYLLLEREFISLFDQVIEKETKVAYWVHLCTVFTAPYLRTLLKEIFVKRVGLIWLEEPFPVFPLTSSILKMVS